ncbi:TIGR04149 family rSAM-modified RiPP [Tenuifilum thalassicum]|uniref:RSAM-modified peptide n=1 Tax=Tenuifilum thalassicum TaxID=2590900 RepID=A0A7D3XEG3_9BACT|nr:TIGR04149 family rSAM-modified RiPP [Tenuifilum thalassicum]QKG79907.1 rSAM-modified peptide [Tenuifilum thalassicum]
MKKLKLNALEAKEMESVKGGYIYIDCFPHMSCGCGCYYANNGGSSTEANASANASTGLHSPLRDGDTVEIRPCPEN